MIEGQDVMRILEDVKIALDALGSIKHVIERDKMVALSYLQEKIEKAKSCIAFITGCGFEHEDFVKVTRCRNCRFYSPEEQWCTWNGSDMTPSDHCSKGK